MVLQIPRYAPLSFAEQEACVARFRETGDKAALQPLVLSHMAFALKEIRPFVKKYPDLRTDLESSAFLGLLKAATKYDPGKGFQFSTYARWWIKSAIHEEIFANQSLITIPMTAQTKKAIASYRKIMDRLKAENPDKPEEDLEMLMAAEMEMDYEQFRALRRLVSGGVVSMDARIRHGEDEATVGSRIPSEDPTPEEKVMDAQEASFFNRCITEALDDMVEEGPDRQRDLRLRQRDIFVRRRLGEDPETLEAIASDYGISRERVRQVESKALETFNRAFRKRIANQNRTPDLPAEADTSTSSTLEVA